MRRLAAGAFTLSISMLATDRLVKGSDLMPWATTLLVAVAVLSAVYWLGTTALLRPYLYFIAITRHGLTIELELIPPKRPRKRRLKRQTFDLVNEIYDYLSLGPDREVDSFERWRGELEATKKAGDEAEKDRIWWEYRVQERERDAEEQRELEQLFSGRIRYLAGEYMRRELISRLDAELLEWRCKNSWWIRQVARDLEVLARRL